MAKVTPSIAGFASIVVKVFITTSLSALKFSLIIFAVPANAPNVLINLPTINIAGPIEATIKPVLTIKLCTSGLSPLKPSTK